MSEILHIFHQSPPSHHQMHTNHVQQGHLMNVESQFNWSSLLDSEFSYPASYGVSDHFPHYEFGDSYFTNFTNSSIDELSPILDQNQNVKKRKLEFDVVEVDSQKHKVEWDSELIEPPRTKKNTLNENSKPKIDMKQDYIHVRARRGEATDSHSIAERARREKIKNKMQKLQDLVPGCDKMTNTAAILDEIITYVQCLQSDVEILKMKLVASTTCGLGYGQLVA